MGAHVPIHVYPLPDSFNTALMPGHMGFERMYDVEQLVHERLLRDSAPAESARLFFVPVYATAYFNGRFKAGVSQQEAADSTKELVRSALRLVQQQPYWARRGGSDHIFVFAQDFGRCSLAPSEADRAIGIQVSGDPLPGDGSWGGAQGDGFGDPPDESFDAAAAAAAELDERTRTGAQRCFMAPHDIVVPPLVEPPAHMLDTLLANNGTAAVGSAATGLLARFHGTVERLVPSYSFGVRQRLWHHFGSDTAVQLLQGNAQSGNPDAYWSELASSPFCLAPPGHARWSLRMTEALVAGCVPVLFDVGELALPWQRQLDYDSFALRVRDVRGLRDQLAAARPRLPAMHSALQAARRGFLWSDESAQGPFNRLLYALDARAPQQPEAEALQPA